LTESREERLVSYFGKDDPRLEDIRRRGQDAARAEDWAGLRAMEAELRADEVFWPGVWAPISSYAAWKLGDPHARLLLEEAIAAGLDGPGGLEAELTEAFGADPDWPELAEAMRANVAGPSLELLEWPTSRLTRPIRLFRLADERATLLREQVPAREDAAWETAVRLLAWVSARWPHANAHVDEQDAVEILRLVEKGKRFACVEYSTVLSQALNAFGIPARVVNLYTDDYHVGLGKGHVVSEAWIDRRDDWVVFDGQNGMYWTDEDGGPLGVPTLQDRFRSGRRPAAHVTVGPKPVRDPDAELWWRYFAHASPTGATWAGTSFVPTFQSEGVVRAEVLLHDRAEAYPDLAEVTIGVDNVDGGPAIRVHTEHPYAVGFRITTSGASPVTFALDEAWALPRQPAGDHTAEIATVTPFGALTPSTVTFRVR
jgi:Transglutaminase-like superfamily